MNHFQKKQGIFSEGDLGDAVRASMSYPFFFKPIKKDGVLLYDGGLYNNFPHDVMRNDFNPDYMIGVVVSDNPTEPDERDIMSQVENMIINRSNYRLTYDDGIQFDLDIKGVNLLDFHKIDQIVEAGFDVILHATNHALDKGKKGAMNCMNFWEEQYPDIPYLGINETEEQQDRIYIYEQDGMKLAILNYTYGTNGISTPADMPYLVNYLEKEQVVEDLQLANELADFTIVCPHWGKEYYLGVSAEQKRWTKIFLENGVDLVLGTHPHVIEPVEWVEDEAGNRMLVYYSLGNFVNGTSGTGEGVMNRCVGGLAEVQIGRDETGQVVIQEYDCIPLVCHIAEGEAYTVWYLKDYTEELASENHIRKQDASFSLENCKKLIEEVWGAEGDK